MSKRALSMLGLSVLSASCLGQDLLGTKADPIGSAAGGTSGGIGPLVNVLLALGIVYGLLRFVGPKVVARMNKRLVTAAGSSIRIEESASFAGGSLYVVSARGRSLLVSVGSSGVQCLADLTEEGPKAPEPLTFAEMVGREMPRAVVSASNEPEKSDGAVVQDPWADALARLERIAR